jgi:hypothetical protein
MRISDLAAEATSLHRQLSHYAAKIVLSQWYQAWNFFKDAYVYT